MNVRIIVIATISIILVGSVVYPIIEDFNTDSKTIDVLIIDGQSNAEYGDNYVCDPEVLNAEYQKAPAHNVYYYGTSAAPCNKWDWVTKYDESWAAFHIHNAYDLKTHKWKIGGYEPILGNTISEKSGNDVLVINMAIGARAIDDLLPGGSDGYYSWGVLDHALKQIKKNYDNINMAGVLWIQGESDKDTPVNDYKASFLQLMAAFDQYGANQFYLVHTRDYYGGNSNIAQNELAAQYSNVHMTTKITESFTQENGMLASNADIHYSQKGRDAIAFAIRDQIIIPESHDNNVLPTLIFVIPTMLIVLIAVFVLRSFIKEE